MAEYRRAEIVSGLFIVVSLLVFGLFAFKVVGWTIPIFEDRGVECEVWFSDVKDLDDAAKVTMGGHRVGNVTKIGPPILRPFTETEIAAETRRTSSPQPPPGWGAGRERQVIPVRFKIKSSEIRLAPDATVAVVQEGFIGPYYLAIDPGTWREDDKPPLIRQRKDLPVKLEPRKVDTLEDFMPLVRPIIQQVETVLVRIENDLLRPLLDGREQDLQAMIPELRGALTDARSGVNEIRAILDPKEADSPVRRLNALLENTDRSIVDLKRQLSSDILEPMNAAIVDARAALESGRKALDEAKLLVSEARPGLKATLENLRVESEALKARLDLVQEKLARLLDEAAHLASLQQADVAVIMESFRNMAWELEIAARKVRANPAVLIFGDEEKQALQAQPRDDSGLRKSGRVKPYEQRDESPTKKD